MSLKLICAMQKYSISGNKGLWRVLGWQSACIAHTRPWVWSPVPKKLGGVILILNPTTWGGVAGRTKVQGQLHLHGEFEASLGHLRVCPGAGVFRSLCPVYKSPVFQVDVQAAASSMSPTIQKWFSVFFSCEIILVYHFSTTYFRDLMGNTLIDQRFSNIMNPYGLLCPLRVVSSQQQPFL